MKNKKNKINDDYRQLRNKIFTRTLIMVMAAVAVIWFVYSFVLFGNFADWTVRFFENVFRMDPNSALKLYQLIFRNNMVLFFMLGIALVFFVIFRIYLNLFTKYFGEINRGIDALVKEDTGEIALSPELSATEKKLNSIRHTLEKRKADTLAADQRKNDLLVYLAHDLKTPLTSVIGYLTLLRDENQISEELREKYLSISLEKAERLEDLINEFFEITRFNLSNIPLEYSRVNLTRMLEQLIFEFKPMFLEKGLDCRLLSPPDLMITCDADKMQRVFDNLLRNAVFYSFENSSIEVTAAQEEDSLVISFINQGNTIPKARLERIFEQFYRLDGARSSNSGGAGLGLAIAKEIVELHGGRITAQSADEKNTFRTVLPLS